MNPTSLGIRIFGAEASIEDLTIAARLGRLQRQCRTLSHQQLEQLECVLIELIRTRSLLRLERQVAA